MTTTQPFEFERALKELEGITQWFESSDVDLDQGLVKFERGLELASQLKSHLAVVENRVEKIKQRFAEPAATAINDAPPTVDEPSAPADEPPAPAGESEQTDLFKA